jgi:photosystem II stability/assembly factor-like uncharacterized protein
MQDSGTNAGLRGIDSVDGTVAWASGTGGTVLRTIDSGAHWQKCAIPDAATDGATLDFRGVQAWDAMTAIVMASGPGKKSRLYKTTDGCGTWKLVFKNPDKDGFWDAMRFSDRKFGAIVGDPVGGKIYARLTSDGGASWHRFDDDDALRVGKLQSRLFAASNSALILPANPNIIEVVASIGIGNTSDIYEADFGTICDAHNASRPLTCHRGFTWSAPEGVPIPSRNDSSGVFSLDCDINEDWSIKAMVAVGGDYHDPNNRFGTAAYTVDSGLSWDAAQTPPHGFRSAVQWSEALNAWITVGTNGSDLSRDDGKTWQPLDNGNWNALSLPFVVGPNGRIARMNPAALPAGK